MNNYSSLEKCPLFAGISHEDLKTVIDCLNAKKAKYSKGEYIFEAGQKINDIGIVLSGSVNVVQDDFWGNRTILADIREGGLFGEAFACAEIDEVNVSVVCKERTEILKVDYSKVSKTCSSTCIYHSKMITNMLNILANKNVMLTKKIEHITKRSTREKLLSFLSDQAKQKHSSSFKIQFDRQGLADYLAVDRSAMSNELSKLKDEGLIDYRKNAFELFDI